MKNEHLIKYKNPVLIKDEEGKVKQTTYDLPGEKHTYGKKNVDDPTSIKNGNFILLFSCQRVGRRGRGRRKRLKAEEFQIAE